MLKKVLYMIGIIGLPMYSYGVTIGASTESDATGYNFGPHCAHHGNYYTYVTYHTISGGHYEGHRVSYFHFNEEWGDLIFGEGSENVAYPSVAADYWWNEGMEHTGSGAEVYLTGSIQSHPWGGENYPIPVPMGTGIKVRVWTHTLLTYLDIPIPSGHYAGAPSITYGIARVDEESGQVADVWFITFIEYNSSYEAQSVEIWGLTALTHEGTAFVDRWVSIGGLPAHACNPSTAVWLVPPEWPQLHPSDFYLHIAWDNVGSIGYAVYHEGELIGRTTLESGDYLTPQISSYGDNIYLVWRQAESGDTNVYRRTREATHSDDNHLDWWWYERTNLSGFIPDVADHSHWPQGSSNAVTFLGAPPDWYSYIPYMIVKDPEASGPDFWEWVTDDPTNTPGPSYYPNIVTYNIYDEEHNVIAPAYDIAWTERVLGQPLPYRIAFATLYHPPISYRTMNVVSSNSRIQIAPGVATYAHIKCGDSIPSYYCRKRDGYTTFNRHSVDVGSKELVYIFPYLKPASHYLVRAVISVPQFIPDSSSSISEVFNFDGEKVYISTTPVKPETLDFILPDSLYKEDNGIRLRINREKGAWLEDLKIYEFKIRNRTQNQTPQGISSREPYHSLATLTVTPSIFSSIVRIQYQTAGAKRITLGVYDAAGKLVRKLREAMNVKDRTYNIVWNGRDGEGRLLPSGIYFIRLETEDSALTRKVMLIR